MSVAVCCSVDHKKEHVHHEEEGARCPRRKSLFPSSVAVCCSVYHKKEYVHHTKEGALPFS